MQAKHILIQSIQEKLRIFGNIFHIKAAILLHRLPLHINHISYQAHSQKMISWRVHFIIFQVQNQMMMVIIITETVLKFYNFMMLYISIYHIECFGEWDDHTCRFPIWLPSQTDLCITFICWNEMNKVQVK